MRPVTIDPTTFELTEENPQQCFTIIVADDLGNPLVGAPKGDTDGVRWRDRCTSTRVHHSLTRTSIRRSRPVAGATQFTACLTRQPRAVSARRVAVAPACRRRRRQRRNHQVVSLTVDVESDGSGGGDDQRVSRQQRQRQRDDLRHGAVTTRRAAPEKLTGAAASPRRDQCTYGTNRHGVRSR